MSIESTKSAEVATLARRLRPVVGCPTCAVGIAIDMVGKHWGDAEYDWKGASFGHECRVTRDGLTKAQVAAVGKVDAAYSGAERAA